MKSIRRLDFLSMVLVCFMLTGCGNDPGSENQRVSMGEDSPQPSHSQSQQTSSPSSSMNVEALFEETGIYPTKRETYQDGQTVVTLNGQLVVKKIQISDAPNAIVEWPVVPGDQGDKNVIWFENFDLKKALDQALVTNRSFPKKKTQLEITKIRANPYESGSLRGFMDITFNEAITANGVKLMRTDGEYWIAWPSVKTDDGNYEDLLGASSKLKKRLIEHGRDEMGL